MTKLEAVIERLRSLPAEEQEDVAEIVEQMLDEERGDIVLNAAQEAELARRLNGPDDYASDEEAEAFFDRHGK